MKGTKQMAHPSPKKKKPTKKKAPKKAPMSREQKMKMMNQILSAMGAKPGNKNKKAKK